jgi:hypothetical protein
VLVTFKRLQALTPTRATNLILKESLQDWASLRELCGHGGPETDDPFVPVLLGRVVSAELTEPLLIFRGYGSTVHLLGEPKEETTWKKRIGGNAAEEQKRFLSICRRQGHNERDASHREPGEGRWGTTTICARPSCRRECDHLVRGLSSKVGGSLLLVTLLWVAVSAVRIDCGQTHINCAQPCTQSFSTFAPDSRSVL